MLLFTKFPTVQQLKSLPAGDRGPRLRTLIAETTSSLDGAPPHIQAHRLRRIERLREVGRLAGVELQ